MLRWMPPYIDLKQKVEISVRRRQRTHFGLYFFCLILIGVAMIAYQIWNTDYMQRKFVYKWPYGTEVHTYSAKYRVDPYLAEAVIKNESGFKPDAQSHRGAMGLMQIMPETGAWIAKSTDFPNFKDKMLLLPELNIKFGCWYLSELEHEFKQNDILLLAAYNAGRGTVHDWMDENGWDYTFNDISQIPLAETRNYVTKVIHDKKRYQELYQDLKAGS